MDREKEKARAEALWAYYRAAAYELGRDRAAEEKNPGEPAPQAGYSVYWYFSEHGPEKNLLTRAFLGDSAAMDTVRAHIRQEPGLPPLYGEAPARFDERYLLEGQAPDDFQKQAIETALTMPVSFIKGPPGSGKTATILHLLSCILGQGKTAAVVSANGEAINSIADKLQSYTDPACPKQQALKKAFARLGNKEYRLAFMGRYGARRPDLFPAGETGKGRGKKAAWPDIRAADFLKSWPIVASTVHSLPRTFSDWKDGAPAECCEPLYDYVIADETSQMNALLGLLIMGSARHLVLVGDDDQLPPVTAEERIHTAAETQEAAARALWDDSTFDDIYALREERSFLTICREVFLGKDDALAEKCDRGLWAHYRCHPGIIGICKQLVYGDRMEIRTPEKNYDGSHPVPVRVTWFEGNYCESCPREDDKDAWSKRNCRQAEIFLTEEWPALAERLCADDATVLDLDGVLAARAGLSERLTYSVLSPFQGQLEYLDRRLKQWLGQEENRQAMARRLEARRPALIGTLERIGPASWLAQKGHEQAAGEMAGTDAAAIADWCIATFPDRLRPVVQGKRSGPGKKGGDPMEVRLPELTVSKAQGREYDIVYFLPVEDVRWEWPWSQKKRLVNVAVSRAKKELRIIASASLMSERVQQALTGRAVRPWVKDADQDEPRPGQEDNAFLQKTVDLLWDAGPAPGAWTDGPFGFHRARSRSVFDRAAWVSSKRSYGEGKKVKYPSAPEICMQDLLAAMPETVGEKLTVLTEAPLSALVPALSLEDVGPERRAELEAYVENGARFDILVCQGGRVLLAVEIDGGFHRKSGGSLTHDEWKDEAVRRGFGAAVYTAAADAAVGEAAGGSFAFLRLPTDGTAWNERETVSRLLREQLDRGGQGGYYLYYRPVNALTESEQKRLFSVRGGFVRPQDWQTGAFPTKETADRRWVPVLEKPDEKEPRKLVLNKKALGLMMAYLPRKGKDRLQPDLVCAEAFWPALKTELGREARKGKRE